MFQTCGYGISMFFMVLGMRCQQAYNVASQWVSHQWTRLTTSSQVDTAPLLDQSDSDEGYTNTNQAYRNFVQGIAQRFGFNCQNINSDSPSDDLRPNNSDDVTIGVALPANLSRFVVPQYMQNLPGAAFQNSNLQVISLDNQGVFREASTDEIETRNFSNGNSQVEEDQSSYDPAEPSDNSSANGAEECLIS